MRSETIMLRSIDSIFGPTLYTKAGWMTDISVSILCWSPLHSVTRILLQVCIVAIQELSYLLTRLRNRSFIVIYLQLPWIPRRTQPHRTDPSLRVENRCGELQAEAGVFFPGIYPESGQQRWTRPHLTTVAGLCVSPAPCPTFFLFTGKRHVSTPKADLETTLCVPFPILTALIILILFSSIIYLSNWQTRAGGLA